MAKDGDRRPITAQMATPRFWCLLVPSTPIPAEFSLPHECAELAGCFCGIDMATRAELIGADLSVKEIRDFVGADSLHYISLDGLIDSVPNEREGLCTACFTGDYPIPVPGEHDQLTQIKFDFDALEKAHDGGSVR